jgi:hypothetical protein
MGARRDPVAVQQSEGVGAGAPGAGTIGARASNAHAVVPPYSNPKP